MFLGTYNIFLQKRTLVKVTNLTPTKSDRLPAFYQGRDAFRYGRLWDNPYKPGTLPNKEWEAGVNAAYFDNLKRINATNKAST